MLQKRFPMTLKAMVKQLKHTLANQPQILFAYLHGSALSSEKPRDIDVAVYLISEEFDMLQTKAERTRSRAIIALSLRFNTSP
jgi:predicted nucleotidyltransferase